MIKVTSVEAKANYTLVLTFSDGLHGELCIKDRLFGVMFEPLKDVEVTNGVKPMGSDSIDYFNQRLYIVF